MIGPRSPPSRSSRAKVSARCMNQVMFCFLSFYFFSFPSIPSFYFIFFSLSYLLSYNLQSFHLLLHFFVILSFTFCSSIIPSFISYSSVIPSLFHHNLQSFLFSDSSIILFSSIIIFVLYFIFILRAY